MQKKAARRGTAETVSLKDSVWGERVRHAFARLLEHPALTPRACYGLTSSPTSTAHRSTEIPIRQGFVPSDASRFATVVVSAFVARGGDAAFSLERAAGLVELPATVSSPFSF